MTFEEQTEYRAWLREVFERKAPLAQTRLMVEDGHRTDIELWSTLHDLGVLSLAIPEEFGGAEVSPIGVSIFLEEAGRVLLPAAYLTSLVTAPSLLLAVGDEAINREILPQVAAGRIRVGFADEEAADSAALVAQHKGSGWLLSGTKVDVLDGDAADTFLVSANSEDGGASLFLVGADDPGVTRTTPRCMDDTRPVSTVVFDGASSRLVGTECTSGEALRATRILLRLALAAESVGAAEYCMEMAAEYAKTRHQFGRPIGQFQSIKHKCADMFVDVQASLAAVHSAFTEIEESGSCSELSSAVASTFVADAFVRIASSNMQIHGGIALTWEHSAQLFLKRAKATQLLFGSPDTEIARIGAMIFDGGMSSPSEAYA